jgi:hypothetical protein
MKSLQKSRTHLNLGTLAQERGDYPEAERLYRRSLEIDERLGDQSGAATTTSQLGVLATDRGHPRAGVPLQLHALSIHLRLGSPNAGIDLHWLAVQRQALGERDFAQVLGPSARRAPRPGRRGRSSAAAAGPVRRII